MRIAYILDRFPNLSETFILNQITGVIDRGHEVRIYSGGPGDAVKVHSDYCGGADIDKSGSVDEKDLLIFSHYWLGK